MKIKNKSADLSAKVKELSKNSNVTVIVTKQVPRPDGALTLFVAPDIVIVDHVHMLAEDADEMDGP